MPNPSSWQRWKNIMKCYPFEERRLLKWKPPFIIQPKYDGFRCRAVKTPSGEWLLLSSEENPFFSVPHINEHLKSIKMADIELDGELYIHGMSFDKLSSILSRTQNLHHNSHYVKFHIFDYVSPEMCGERLANLAKYLPQTPLLKLSPYWLCSSLTEIMKVYNELIRQNYEGIIARNAYAPYERKRSTWVMKFKPKQSDDYTILGYIEEISKDGIPKDRLGALVCASGDGHTFNVGTGFSADQREELWKVKETLIGKTAHISFQHITSGNKVPRFPVFVDIKYEV